MKGSYVLLLKLAQRKKIKIGKKGFIDFKQGWYVYIGSALNSLSGRINRHLKEEKKLHWHIDYFLQHASIETIHYKESDTHEECMIAEAFSKQCNHIPSFGCSDCHCQSHLFYGSKKQLLKIIDHFEMIQYSKGKHLKQIKVSLYTVEGIWLP